MTGNRTVSAGVEADWSREVTRTLVINGLKDWMTGNRTVLPVAATCSFCGQTRPSASEVSPSRLLSSGTHFHLTSAHHSTVADSSDQSWKLIFSDKPTTLHDSSANYCLRVKLCNCNHIRLITVCIADIRRIQLSPYPNEFTSKKNNRIVKDARFDFILNSNIDCNKK